MNIAQMELGTEEEEEEELNKSRYTAYKTLHIKTGVGITWRKGCRVK